MATKSDLIKLLITLLFLTGTLKRHGCGKVSIDGCKRFISLPVILVYTKMKLNLLVDHIQMCR